MKKHFSLMVLIGAFSSAQSETLSLPSDEEMLAKGREVIVTSINSEAVEGAERESRKSTYLEVPPKALNVSPLAKKLADETFSYSAKKWDTNSLPLKGSELIVFVSFSMPDDVLSEYSKQAKEAGAVIVLRGMWRNSIRKTQMRAAAVNKEFAQWDINPGLFRKFNVDRVPSIILADSNSAQIVEDGCAQPSSYLRLDGAISIRQALLLMRQRGEGELAQDAASRLSKLENQK